MTADHPSVRRILALPGSLRRLSYNRRLLDAAARMAPAALVIEVYDALDKVPLFDEDLEASTQGGPHGVRRLRAAVAAADGMLIATPEYNHSIPGVLKNAIDWLSRSATDELLSGKPIAIVGVSSGRWGTRLAQAALRQVLAATESQVMPAPMLFMRDASQLFDGDGGLADRATQETLRDFLRAFSRWIDVLSREEVSL